MTNNELYVIGSVPVPDWCRDKLIPYQKSDGSIGYEFHSHIRDVNLVEGDELIRVGRKIYFKRQVNIFEKE